MGKLSQDDIKELAVNIAAEIDKSAVTMKSSSINEARASKKIKNKNLAKRLLESSSDESFVSFRNESESDSNDVNHVPINNKAMRALSFSEASSSNDVPQRSRSPKRKGSTMRRPHVNKNNLPKPNLSLSHENGNDEGDESERSVQEARSPKRSSKTGPKASQVPNGHLEQADTIGFSQASNSFIHLKRGNAKRGKPEPMTPKKIPGEEEDLPWLLRDSNSAKKKSRIESALEDAYDRNPFPTMDEISELEAITNMS